MINVKLVTPTGELYDGKASKLIMTTTSGEITVLRGHEPLITTVDFGQLIIEDENQDKKAFSVYKGVAHISNISGETSASIMIETGEDVKTLDSITLEEAIKKAQIANTEKDSEFGLEINESLIRDLNRIKLARRYRG